MTPGRTGRIPPVPSDQSRRMGQGKCPCSSCVNAESSRTFLETGVLPLSTFIVCPDCGNKRCPKASRHDYLCTQSNALGQVGTIQSRDETLEQENTRLHEEVEDWIGMYRIAVSRADAAEDGSVDMLRALLRAERKLSAYVGVCKSDKELTDTVLPMIRAITHIFDNKVKS